MLGFPFWIVTVTVGTLFVSAPIDIKRSIEKKIQKSKVKKIERKMAKIEENKKQILQFDGLCDDKCEISQK